MKPSLTVQEIVDLPKFLESSASFYQFIENMAIITDVESLEALTDSCSFLSISATIDKLFSDKFIEAVLKHKFALKSTTSYSQLTALSCTIDEFQQMSLTMSRSLDQATGLDASQELVDSCAFESSTRLLSFDLLKLSKEHKRLQRIQSRCQQTLSNFKYSCKFIVVVRNESFKDLSDTLIALEISSESLSRPSSRSTAINSLPCPNSFDFDIADSPFVLELFDWLSLCLKFESSSKRSRAIAKVFPNQDDNFTVSNSPLYFHQLSWDLLPASVVFQVLKTLLSAANFAIISVTCCKGIPPNAKDNAARLKHFNPRSFDATARTADDSGFAIFKCPARTLTFKLNRTA